MCSYSEAALIVVVFFLRLSAHNISKKIKSGGVRRGLRHSQSMKGKNHAVATLPGVCEQSVKLQTLRPIILSNIEHIGEYNNFCLICLSVLVTCFLDTV